VFHFLFNLWGTTSAEWLTVEDPMLISLIVIGGTIIGLVAGILFFRRGNSLVGRAAAKAQ
jgi:membrane protease YdiL (CAAX protease family)